MGLERLADRELGHLAGQPAAPRLGRDAVVQEEARMAGDPAVHEPAEADQALGLVALRDRPVAEAASLPVVDPALQLRLDSRAALRRGGRAEPVHGRVGVQGQERIQIVVPRGPQDQAASDQGSRYGGGGLAELRRDHEKRNSVETLGG
ncbi:RNA polymerase sigma factor SigM domain protein [Ostertagia ostertagi]